MFYGFAHAESAQQSQLLERSMTERVRWVREGGPQIERHLISVVESPRQSLRSRWRALTTLGQVDARKFRQVIERCLQSKDWFLRNAALLAIRHDERTKAIEWSMKLVDDHALVVRTQAVRNLAEMHATESEEKLWQALNAKSNFRRGEGLWVRAHIAEGLSQLASPQSVTRFFKMLEDDDSRLHKWGVIGLERLSPMRITDPSEPVDVRREKWLAFYASRSQI